MKTTHKFWPLDFDPEVAIYDNLSWDLPGLKRFGRTTPTRPQGSNKRRPAKPRS
jgi:hypothetical protein